MPHVFAFKNSKAIVFAFPFLEPAFEGIQLISLLRLLALLESLKGSVVHAFVFAALFLPKSKHERFVREANIGFYVIPFDNWLTSVYNQISKPFAHVYIAV